MAVKAIIMAGGAGVRLQPMTCLMPKPLVPILEKPVMEYTLLLLRRHGIRDVTVTLCHHGHQIRETFGNGNRYGMKLHYVQEDAPRGTAGSILPLRKHMNSTFIVLSGDALTDCDLRDALRFHQEHNALATLVLKKVPDPLAYGVVLTNAHSRITQFIEKPDRQQACSDLVNTGIYLFEPEVFDYIPPEGAPDFAKDVFPKLMQEHKAICGYEMQGYWCDVGSQQAYLDAQLDLLKGRIAFPCPQRISPTAVIHPSARLLGSCYVGAHAHVGPGAELRDALLFENSRAEARAVIRRSCLWQHAIAGEDAFLNQSILCEYAHAHRDSVLSENCALGKGAEAAGGSTLRPGVKIYPFLSASPDSHVRCSVLGKSVPSVLHKNMLTLRSPEEACRFAAALCTNLHPPKILVTSQDAAHPLLSILSGALSAQGLPVSTAVLPSLPQAQALGLLQSAACTLYIHEDRVAVLTASGDPLNRKTWQTLLQSMEKDQASAAFLPYGRIDAIPDAEKHYLQSILPPDVHPASINTHFRIFCSHKPLLKLCGKALINAGARYVSMSDISSLSLASEEAGFILHEDGTHLLPITQDLTPTPEQNTLLSLLCCRIYNGKLYNTHPLLPKSAEIWGALSPEDESAACKKQKLLLRDGVALCAHMAPLLGAQTLQHWLYQLPESHVQEQTIPCLDKEKGRILRKLCQTALPYHLDEGLLISHPRGHASITPDAAQALIRIRSESRDSEFARELCDLYSRKVRDLLSEKTQM